MDGIISAGDRLDVNIDDKRCTGIVQSVVGGERIIIFAPVYRGEHVLLSKGEFVNITYYRQSGMYTFIAMVASLYADQDGQPRCELEIKSPISKYQRREFVRYDAELPLFVRVVGRVDENTGQTPEERLNMLIYDGSIVGSPRRGETEYEEIDSLTIDISGNGLRFSTALEMTFGTLLECTIELSEGKTVTVDCKVIRIDRTAFEGRFIICVQFVNIEEHVRRKIIRFIFERRMGLRNELVG